MKAFRPLWLTYRIALLEWAMKEICPAHEDVPGIVLELAALTAERNAR